ncbi:MAG: FHA domain-containing protein [Deltaproteobacteria bacterium]|nr:FHA domain-containing protein [Deltaproteobacteria bacterium]
MDNSKTKFRLKFMFQQIDLNEGSFTIGRCNTCNLTVEDVLVSREHAVITIENETATIRDLNSRNGTFVNNIKIKTEKRLHSNDRIVIGKQNFLFLINNLNERTQKKTGAMIYCTNCTTPIAAGPKKCPHCGTDIPVKEKS